MAKTMVYHIELRCPGVDDPKQLETLKESTRIAARNLFAAAMLVMTGDNKPAIAAYSEDFITGEEEIMRKDKVEEGDEA